MATEDYANEAARMGQANASLDRELTATRNAAESFRVENEELKKQVKDLEAANSALSAMWKTEQVQVGDLSELRDVLRCVYSGRAMVTSARELVQTLEKLQSSLHDERNKNAILPLVLEDARRGLLDGAGELEAMREEMRYLRVKADAFELLKDMMSMSAPRGAMCGSPNTVHQLRYLAERIEKAMQPKDVVPVEVNRDGNFTGGPATVIQGELAQQEGGKP